MYKWTGRQLQVLYAVHTQDTPSPSTETVLRVGNSVLVLFVVAAVAIWYVPSDLTFAYERYQDAGITLTGMGTRFQRQPLLTIVLWLVPAIATWFVPLWTTRLPLGAASLAVGVSSVVCLVSSEERRRLAAFWRTAPEAGYMWQEVALLSSCAFLVDPTSFLVLMGGPSSCVCLGRTTTTRPAWLFLILAVASIVTVLPSVSHLVDDSTGEFFLNGYTSESVFATLLAVSMMLVWVRTYHLVVRGARVWFLASLRWNSAARAIGASSSILYLLVGTALVQIWVCSAFALHLAVTSSVESVRAHLNACEDPLEREARGALHRRLRSSAT